MDLQYEAVVKAMIFCISNANVNRSCFPGNMTTSPPGITKAQVYRSFSQSELWKINTVGHREIIEDLWWHLSAKNAGEDACRSGIFVKSRISTHGAKELGNFKKKKKRQEKKRWDDSNWGGRGWE